MSDPKPPSPEDREAALRVLDGPLSDCCTHDASPAYMKKYECFPAEWNDHGQGDGCFWEALAAAFAAHAEQARQQERERCAKKMNAEAEEHLVDSPGCKTFCECYGAGSLIRIAQEILEGR